MHISRWRFRDTLRGAAFNELGRVLVMQTLIQLLMVDARTLAFVSCIGGFIMAATMLGLYIGGSRRAGVLQWATGGLVFGIGYLFGHLLLTLQPDIPGWIAGGIANNLIMTGHVLILLGVQCYLGHRQWTWALLIPIVAGLANAIPALRQFPILFIVDTALLVAVDSFAAFLLWRARSPGMTVYRRVTATVLMAFALFMAGRTTYMLVTRAVSGSFDAHTFQILVFLIGMLFGFVLTMALVLMIFREKELRMREIARRDALTGLHNRYALGEISVREYGMARRYDNPMTLVALDLDHFKDINDRFGHAGGDLVLAGVAATMRASLRDADLIFRVGGEEFLILLPFTRTEEARRVAERLRAQIQNAKWSIDDRALQVTASLGIAELQPNDESWDQAMVRADRALYCAKESGRNRVQMAVPASRPAHLNPVASAPSSA